jgi:hypothetical protein
MRRQGALFLLSKWYKRSELGLRTAILSCGGLLSNAFGSLIASGILDGMEGVLGHAAWRWYVTLLFENLSSCGPTWVGYFLLRVP